MFSRTSDTYFNDEFFDITSSLLVSRCTRKQFCSLGFSRAYRSRLVYLNPNALHSLLSIRAEYDFHRKCTFNILHECMRIFRMACRTYCSATLRRATWHLLISSIATLRENAFPRRTETQLATLDKSRAKYMRRNILPKHRIMNFSA